MQGVYKNLILFLLLALVIVGFIAYGTQEDSQPGAQKVVLTRTSNYQTRVTASGIGVASSEPDRATINASIISEGTTADEAEDKNRQKTTQVIFILKSLSSVKVPDQNITTTDYRLEPIYVYPEDGKPELKGYRTENVVSVRVSDIKDTGAIVAALTSGGVDSIQSVEYSVSQTQQLKDKALQRACRNAAHRARVMAQTMGMKLSDIVYIKDGEVTTENPVPVFSQVKAEAEITPDMLPDPEKIKVTATCQMTFNLIR